MGRLARAVQHKPRRRTGKTARRSGSALSEGLGLTRVARAVASRPKGARGAGAVRGLWSRVSVVASNRSHGRGRRAGEFGYCGLVAAAWCAAVLPERCSCSLAGMRSSAGVGAEVLSGRPSAEVPPKRGDGAAFAFGLVRPNVRAKLAPAVGRQARAADNVPRTCGPGLVARRWGST